MKLTRSKITFTIEASNIFPALFDKTLLIKHDFIPNDEKIDYNNYRVSNLGSVIKLKDGYKTELDVSFKKITISSCSKSRIFDFFSLLHKGFPKLKIESYFVDTVFHIKNAGIADEVFSRYSKTDFADITYLEFTKEQKRIYVYECQKDWLHLQFRKTTNFPSHPNLEEIINPTVSFLNTNESFLNDFISQELEYKFDELH
jgi:hypothetical protein